MSGLHDYFDHLQASGLFEWVEHVLPDPHVDSESRERLFRAWKVSREAGCRPLAAREETPGSWRLVRFECGPLAVTQLQTFRSVTQEFAALRGEGEAQ